jgi:hypothetical protein
MFKTPYNSIYRIHTVKEALAFPIGKNPTDLILYMIDLYDVLLSILSGKVETPSMDTIDDLRVKCTECLMEHFHAMYKPIPGCLVGWTQSMLLWVIILTLISIQYKDEKVVLCDNLLKYIKTKRLRMFTDPDPKTWDFNTYISMLDVLSLQWNNLEPCDDINELLEIMWRISASFTLTAYTKDVFNIENYTEEMKNSKDHVRISEDGIMLGLSRFYWFNQCMYQIKRWPIIVETFPSIGESNWNTWILKERRHFITRRFRDGIGKFMWDKMLLIGDQEIASHDQLGDQVSAFTCMFARWPAGFVTVAQRLLTYKDYEEIIEFEPLKNYVHVNMIAAHFMSVYNVNWLKYFTVYERNQWKHIDAIERSMVPLILNRYGGYVVYFKGKIYKHQDGKNIEHAFIVWCFILRRECSGLCFDSMDFNVIIEQILDQAEEIDNSRSIDGFFDLEDL